MGPGSCPPLLQGRQLRGLRECRPGGRGAGAGKWAGRDLHLRPLLAARACVPQPDGVPLSSSLPPLLSLASLPAPPTLPPSILGALPLQLRARSAPAAPTPGNPTDAAGGALRPGSGSWVPSRRGQQPPTPTLRLPNVALLLLGSQLSPEQWAISRPSLLILLNSFPLHLSGIPFQSRYPFTSPLFPPLRSLPLLTASSIFPSLSLRPSLCLYSPPPVSSKAWPLVVPAEVPGCSL